MKQIRLLLKKVYESYEDAKTECFKPAQIGSYCSMGYIWDIIRVRALVNDSPYGVYIRMHYIY